ncbi:HAD family hydrolase [Meiothermus granaticius]|uniref:Pyrimidine 5'-nucleotidase YjjG n=1 Tax=Meiothermus granaticius NBRC 107808 TaxID=1227551 RepID=A0A399FBI8_9DEIN|nr:HAD family hydrolase [Meiothermus granaticius]RIH92282.1 Pyrimidine 5'-nucleotidase YjjG [Meiothermus granaticius NBRC 107808]GEM86492.1 2-haloalkanoic acid dehalogenase [Meiothermus granaticius NBRC 107808]
MKPKAITFDFWGTLFVEGPEYAGTVLNLRREILLDAASEAGVPAEEKDVIEAWRQAALDFDAAWNAEQVMTPFERVGLIFKYLKLPYDEGLVALTAQRIVEAGLEGSILPLPGVVEAIPQLAKTYALGIVSDTGISTGRVLREQLRRHKLLDYFTGLSFSDETGFVKPRPEAFKAALEEMGTSPEQTLHIGDIPRTDIAGAFATGYPWAVLYTGHTHRNGGPEPTARVANHLELVQLLGNTVSTPL